MLSRFLPIMLALSLLPLPLAIRMAGGSAAVTGFGGPVGERTTPLPPALGASGPLAAAAPGLRFCRRMDLRSSPGGPAPRTGGHGGHSGGMELQAAASRKDSDYMTERRRVLELVNQTRRDNGLHPLAWNDALAGAAQLRASELNSNFSHTRPDGTEFTTVLSQFGIRTTAWAENIAQGQSDAAAVMNSWLNSKGHRGNMLSGNFSQLGVGAFPLPGRGLSWVQLFAR